MKRVGYLYEDMLDKNLIRRAIIKSLKHKKKTKNVTKVLNNLETYVMYFYNLILAGDYKFKKGHMKEINSNGKTRTIQVPNLKDHIMQHIMMAVLVPIITRSMYKWNCGVVPRRGPICAKNILKKS